MLSEGSAPGGSAGMQCGQGTPFPPPPGLGLQLEGPAPEGSAAMQCSQGTLFPPPPGMGLQWEGPAPPGMQRSPAEPHVPCLPGAGWLAAGAFWHQEQSQAGPLLQVQAGSWQQEIQQDQTCPWRRQERVQAGPLWQELAGPGQQQPQQEQQEGTWQQQQQQQAAPWQQPGQRQP